ncbi:hypothetical protein ABE178_15065 [Priestia megaterium]
MKMETIAFKSVSAASQPVLVAKGPVGGGYVSINSSNTTLGTSEFITDSTKHIIINGEKMFYLLEGEELYSRGQMNTAYDKNVSIIYHNQEPSSQNNNPLSFTGTINLSQS